MQEYANINLESLAQTCISLSTQSKEILDSVMPQYSKLFTSALTEWPFELTPSVPVGKLEKIKYFFVDKLQKFASVCGSIITIGDKTLKLHDKPEQFIIVGDTIYVKGYNVMHAYNIDLKYIGGTTMKYQSFYVDNGAVQFIVASQTRTESKITTYFQKQKISLSKNVTNPGIVFDGTLYLTTAAGTLMISPEDLSETFRADEHYFIQDSKIFWYKHVGDTTHFQHYILPGRGVIYPSINETRIFHCGTYAELLF